VRDGLTRDERARLARLRPANHVLCESGNASKTPGTTAPSHPPTRNCVTEDLTTPEEWPPA